MTPTTAHYSSDSESLQADVMRFMAIIAFCLIAILALVKDAEPVEVSQQLEPTLPEPEIKPPPPVIEPPIEPVALIEPIPDPIIEVVEPEPVPEPVIAEVFAEPAARVIEQPPVEIPPVARPEASPPTPEVTAAEPNPEPVEEAGLTLRFASDGDFLRLIAKGEIKVYAFLETDVLGLNGSYRFMDSPSPGQVYELLTASIPSLIVDALREERSDIRDYRWGIALPNRISSQIERYLDNVEQGQLVIDRYGDVHHVAAS
jgi:hypothetical protein